MVKRVIEQVFPFEIVEHRPIGSILGLRSKMKRIIVQKGWRMVQTRIKYKKKCSDRQQSSSIVIRRRRRRREVIVIEIRLIDR